MIVEERKLGGLQVGADQVLEVLAEAPDGDGGRDVRIFLGAGTDPVRLVPKPGLTLENATSVSKSLMVRARWDGDGDGVPLPLRGGGEARLTAVAPEPELLAGMNVLMATRNGETPGLVVDWLRYHVRGHGAQAALILDRQRPGEPPLAKALQKMLDDKPVPGLLRVVVVTSPLPLGGPGPSERHPITAPDAPGKDRMEKPGDDPWTAPLGQFIVLEALRWRFLTAARAIAWIEVTDLLFEAAAGQNVFDKVLRAKGGITGLIGRRIYPWRIRNGRDPSFGDHVCDQFDNPGGNRRWACVPARIPSDAPFRLVRIGGLKPDPLESVYFFRAMAARVVEGPDMPLAPKAGLILDDGLLSLARDTFGHDPILPPVNDAGVEGKIPAALAGRTAIITCMKNEGPFILEWIAYHRAIGVDDFLIYTNDCTDGTDTLLDLLQGHGIVAHRENPFRDTDMKPQHAALAAAEDEAIMARAGWAICMDVDEFLNIHVGEGTLADLYAAVGDANMISATWRLFGNSDLHDFEDVPTPARFTRCAPQLIRKPHQAWGFKTLFRNINIYKKMGVHRPKGLKPDLWEQVDWVNGSGQPMPKEMLRTGWRSTVDTYGYDLVTLNHYAVRDAESFLVKRDRGRVNHVARDQGLGYWFRMNNNAEEDRSIQRMLPQMEAEMEVLKALPGVAAQHDACVAAHRKRIAELRGGDAFADFYAEITSDRMQRLSRMHQHFGSNVFLAGPDAVPDIVVFGDHPPEFFFTVEEVDETQH